MKTQLIIIPLFFISTLIFSQNGGIRINGGTHLITTNAPKIVIQNGDFYSDAADFSFGQSEIIFTGTANFNSTTIDGGAGLEFYNLTVNKDAAGILLKKNIFVHNDLTFQKGLIDLNSNSLQLVNNGKLINESEDSRIIGSSGGEVSKLVNLNAPNNENPGNLGAIITSPKNLGQTMIYRGHAPQSGAGNSGIQRYYDIIPANNDALSATFRFNYFDAELNGISEQDLTLYRKTGGTWEDMGIDNHNQIQDWAELFGIDHFSIWTLGSITNPLPLEWLSFTARLNEKSTVDLNWETALEENNDYFLIKKSKDGVHFMTVDTVRAQQNEEEVKHYYYEDDRPYVGNNYYKIKQMDKTGAYSFSEIRMIDFGSKDFGLAVFPNPSAGQIETSFEIETVTPVQIDLSDTLGRKLKNLMSETHFAKGVYSEFFDLSDFPKGVYFLDFKADRVLKREKIILQ